MRRSGFEYLVDRPVGGVLSGNAGDESAELECESVFDAIGGRQVAGLANSTQGEPMYLVVDLNPSKAAPVPVARRGDPNDWWQRFEYRRARTA